LTTAGAIVHPRNAIVEQVLPEAGHRQPLEIGIVVSAQKLTDEAAHTWLQCANQPFTYDDWGGRYGFGVKFKLSVTLDRRAARIGAAAQCLRGGGAVLPGLAPATPAV